MNNNFFDVDSDLKSIEGEVAKTRSDINRLSAENCATQNDISRTIDEINEISAILETDLCLNKPDVFEPKFMDDAEILYDEIFKRTHKEIHSSVPRLPKFSKVDWIAAAGCGISGALIDFFLVGTPQKGRSNKTGSPLTDLLRKIGQSKDGELVQPLKWLSQKCKVPYDIAVLKGVVNTRNHRLRSFAHDPLSGLLFAVFDIKFVTCTCIDDSGHLRIIPNPKQSKDYGLGDLYLLLPREKKTTSALGKAFIALCCEIKEGHIRESDIATRVGKDFMKDFLVKVLKNSNIKKPAAAIYFECKSYQVGFEVPRRTPRQKRTPSSTSVFSISLL